MRLKITLTLLAILLGLLTYIFYLDSRIEDAQFANERRSVLGELAVGIDYFSIQNSQTGQRTTFELRDKQWMLTEPYLWPANEFAVQRILTQLRFLERVTSFEAEAVSSAGASLADYGLAPPELNLQFGRGATRHTLGIGKATDIGNNLYLLSVDKTLVHVVDRSLLDSLSVNIDKLRSPRLFDTAVFEATSWNIQVRENNRNLRARFSRSGEKWVFETPIRARADTAAVNTLLNRCLNLEAESIVAANPTDLSPYGLQNALYRIAVESGQVREALEIGQLVSPDSEYRYAKREDRPSVFQLRIDFLDLLANAQTKLRQRRIFELDASAATTITLEQRDDAPLTLQKLESGTWEIVVRDESQGLQTLKGDNETIEETLLWLDELKAVPDTGFVNDAPSAPDLEAYGLEVPEFSITITSSKLHDNAQPLDTSISETLLIGDRNPEAEGERYVKISGKDFVYSVYNDIFDRVIGSSARYKDRQVLDLPEGASITSIEISRIADDAPIAAFQLRPADQAAPEAKALADEVANLTVDSYNPDGFTSTVEIAGRIQPWAYTLTAKIRRNGNGQNAEETVQLYISETTGGPLLMGGIPERNLSFRFSQPFIDAFSAISFDRAPREKPEDPFSARPLPEPEPAEEPLEATDESTPTPEASEDAPAPANEEPGVDPPTDDEPRANPRRPEPENEAAPTEQAPPADSDGNSPDPEPSTPSEPSPSQ